MASIKFISGQASLQKESLQGFAAFGCSLSGVLPCGQLVNKATIKKRMGEQFLGNPADRDSIWLGEHLKYRNRFSGLHQENIRNVTVNRNDSASQPNTNQSYDSLNLLRCMLLFLQMFGRCQFESRLPNVVVCCKLLVKPCQHPSFLTRQCFMCLTVITTAGVDVTKVSRPCGSNKGSFAAGESNKQFSSWLSKGQERRDAKTGCTSK